ncbi:hypothetical protein HRW18_16075 [Streptomyces lunaelactis]|uniref:hypothetical protein n=1 Tax=Streptomyces lunaelactis TaxID=1535768 RepID=UPI001585CAAC|nr:hypothetical protein [Streptomyces lunaelactis]NUK09494.1 hypothetical protein [Streptomyces lunaelactis]NUK73371.1 hypothetical protein [Streptomyces lunaelactis]NUL10922.1 hypothetical protein [Streptomyces lunaelactis]NUL24514.1 hypothetical protein [Streptomyces lunaelactis]
MPGSRRSQRQRAVSELRVQGRYGPTFRDVLPGFVGLGLAIGLPLGFLGWMYGQLGILGLVLGVALLAGAAVLLVRWRRASARRRGGIYTPAELATLDDHGLAAAAERLLGRDGWHVIAMPDEGRPRLYARDRGGRQLDVGFRSADEVVDGDAPTGPAPLREAGRPGVDNLIRVVVSRGSYSRTDVLWASRQGGVHLLDGRQLQQWAAGASLDDLGLPKG